MKSVLITGCSSGIGLYCARRLHENGWKVYVTARNADDLKILADLGLEAFYLDYAEPESIAALSAWVMEKTDGSLYALFNNGAYGQMGAIEDVPTSALRAQFEANFFGWHDLSNRLIPSMRKNETGRIIQNSSVLGFTALKYRGAYNASKFALEGLSDTLRLELRGTGVFVSLIEPGPIESKFTQNTMPHFEDNIDIEASPHRDYYLEYLQAIKEKGGTMPFRLGPDAVYKRLHHALVSSRPRARYYVTFPTYLFGVLKRVLPVSVLDMVADKVST